MAYGYPGDATPDTQSSQGIGAFAFDDTPGSLVPVQDAGLKKRDAEEIYHVLPGDFFTDPKTGQRHRYADVIPDWSPVPPGYVDVYDPSHPPDKLTLRSGHKRSGGGPRFSFENENLFGQEALAQAQEEQTPGSPSWQPPSAIGAYGTPLASGDIYDPYANPKVPDPPKIDTTSPLEAYRKDNPLDDRTDNDVIASAHTALAPDSDPQKFSLAFRQKNGFQALRDLKDELLSPYQEFKKDLPEASNVPESEVSKKVYDTLVSQGRIDPKITDQSDFEDVFNPKHDVFNAAFNAIKGAGREASAQSHFGSAHAWNTVPDFVDWFYSTMNRVTGPLQAGSKARTLMENADEWAAKNGATKPFEDLWSFFHQGFNAVAAQERGFGQRDVARAAQAQGPAGTAGRVAGGVTAGLATQLVPMMALGSPVRAAAVLASLYMGTSKYAEATEAGHENAWLEGIEGAATAGMFRYMMNSNAGRIRTGFLNAAINSGEDELSRMMRGEKTDWQEFSMNLGVDFLFGVAMGKAAEKGPYTSPENLFHAEDQHPVTAASVLGPGDAKESSSWLKPDPIVGHFTESPWTPQSLQRAISGVVSTTPEGLKAEAARMRPPLSAKLEMHFQQPEIHIEHNGGIPAAAVEELQKSDSAKRAGNGPKARDHVDRAYAVIPSATKRELAKESIEAVKGNGKGKAVFERLYGISPEVRKRQGQAGSIINPGQLLHEFFTDTYPKWVDERMEWWRERFHPEYLGPGAQEMTPISNLRTVEMQNMRRLFPVELAREVDIPKDVDLRGKVERMLHIDDALRGVQKSTARYNAFAKYPRAKRLQWLIDSEPLPGEEPVKSGIPEIDWLTHEFYRPGYDGMLANEQAHNFEYEPRDWYIFHAIAKKDRERFVQWGENLQSNNPRFMNKRVLPRWKDVVDAGFKPQSDNQEDLFRWRSNMSSGAIRKVATLRDAANYDLAYNTKNPNIPQNIKDGAWGRSIRAPNGEHYFVEPNAQKLLHNDWDTVRAYDGFFGPILHGLRFLKTLTSPVLLGLSLAHSRHIGFMALAHSLITPQRVMLRAAGNILEGRGPQWSETLQREAYNKYLAQLLRSSGTTGNRLLDVLQGKRGFDELTGQDKRDYQDLGHMGLQFGRAEEREVDFVRRSSEWLPSGRRLAGGVDSALKLGQQIITSAPLRALQFDIIIPRQKLAAALLSRDRLLADHPEYKAPGHEMEYMIAKSKAGREIEARFGEMNLDTLHWKRAAKDVGVANLLSLGWQLSGIRVYAGAVKDMTSNAAHIRDVFRSNQDPLKRAFFSDRILFLLNYSAISAVSNYLLTYFNTNGYKDKQYEWRDLFFPVIGRNPPGSQQQWARSSPLDFPREIANAFEYAKIQGGGLLGAAAGGERLGLNKLNPVLASASQLHQNTNYWGGQILDPQAGDIEKLYGVIAYMLYNSGTPITLKQFFEPKPGEAPLPLSERVNRTIYSMLGYGQAPQAAYRSDFVNSIYNVYSTLHPTVRTQYEQQKSALYRQLKDAVQAGDENKMQSLINAMSKFGLSNKQIHAEFRSARKNEAPEHRMFKELDPIKQRELLKMATPEEKEQFSPLLKQAPDENNGTENLPHFGSGGIVTEPTVAVVGESGPEMIVPLSDDSFDPRTITQQPYHTKDDQAFINQMSFLRDQMDKEKEMFGQSSLGRLLDMAEQRSPSLEIGGAADQLSKAVEALKQYIGELQKNPPKEPTNLQERLQQQIVPGADPSMLRSPLINQPPEMDAPVQDWHQYSSDQGILHT